MGNRESSWSMWSDKNAIDEIEALRSARDCGVANQQINAPCVASARRRRVGSRLKLLSAPESKRGPLGLRFHDHGLDARLPHPSPHVADVDR